MDNLGQFEFLYQRLQKAAEALIDLLPLLVLALLIAAATCILAFYIGRFIQRLAERAGATPSLIRLFARTVTSIVVFAGALLILNLLGLSQVVLSFVASLGVIGLILGFALQDLARQLAAGTMLLSLRPFEIGDEIKVKDFQGHVVNVKLLGTILRTSNGLEVRIPNADVYTSPITNYSRYGMQRLELPFSVPIASDTDALEGSILALLAKHKAVLSDPKPQVLFLAINDTKVTMSVRFWLDFQASDQEEVQSAVIAQIAELLRSHEV